MKKIFFIIVILFLLPVLLLSQNVGDDGQETNFIYKKEFSFYPTIHTSGWGLGCRWGRNNTVNFQRYIDVSVSTMKHPKEKRFSNSSYFENARSFVYGKQNNVFLFRFSFGSMRVLNEKPYWGGVDVRNFWSVGPTIAIAKPIYLYVVNDSSSAYSMILNLEKYNPEVHNLGNIYGRGPMVKGLLNSKIHPGLTAQTGFSFEFGSTKTVVNFLELGVVADVFLKAIPIMAYNKNERFFVTFFASYHIGKRFNK